LRLGDGATAGGRPRGGEVAGGRTADHLGHGRTCPDLSLYLRLCLYGIEGFMYVWRWWWWRWLKDLDGRFEFDKHVPLSADTLRSELICGHPHSPL
jgi:hypothetical protein